MDVGHQSRGRRVGMEGRLPEQHLEHHNPKRIQVGPVIGVGAHCLLGRHVLGGAQGLVLLREAGRRLQHSSEAEVRQYGPLVLVQEHVGGLEVPVHDALAVRVVQGVGKWVYVLQYLAELQGIAVQTVLKVASGTISLTMYVKPLSSPKSYMRRMFGWFRRAIVCASWVNRPMKVGSSVMKEVEP